LTAIISGLDRDNNRNLSSVEQKIGQLWSGGLTLGFASNL